jgi:bifunctional non-homologous end joining protein LigD
MNMNSVETPCGRQAALYCTEGSSDKVYRATLNEHSTGWSVDFAYGRRGSPQKTGTKTQTPVPFDFACAIYDKLIKEKKSKGYTDDASGVAYTNTDKAGRVSGVLPQLPTSLEASDLETFLTDNAWGIQEKMDGENRLLKIENGQVLGINRKGLYVDIPQEWSEEFLSLPNCLLAGEAVGDKFYAFDLLELNGQCLREYAFATRYSQLLEIQNCASSSRPHFFMVFLYTVTGMKKARLESIKDKDGEGVVFKHLNSPYVAGKSPIWRKHKFVESATCLVTAHNTVRSVAVGLFDENQNIVNVGNVTIPESASIPAVDSLVEVRYMYRFEGGCFEQPVYLGQRNDLDRTDAVLTQVTRIKYKS